MYIQQSKTCWPGIESFIDYARGTHGIVLEGWQIIPQFLKCMLSGGRLEHTSILYLFKKDPCKIIPSLKLNKSKNDWVLKNTHDQETFVKIADMLANFGTLIETEALRYNFRSVNTDDNFIKVIDELSNL